MLSRLLRTAGVIVFLFLIIELCFGITALHRAIPANALTVKPIPSVMPLGDSITYGEGSLHGDGYRYALWQALAVHGMSIRFVGSRVVGSSISVSGVNEGHPGWDINQLSSHLALWLKAYHPQYILLHIGTNDILHNESVFTAPVRLHALLQKITSILPQTTVLVAQIIPIGRHHLDGKVQVYNAAIPGIVKAEVHAGYHISVVDMHRVVSLKDIPDGAHPNDTGYKEMAQAWYTALAPLLSAKTNAQLFLVFEHGRIGHTWNFKDQWNAPKAYYIAVLQQLCL